MRINKIAVAVVLGVVCLIMCGCGKNDDKKYSGSVQSSVNIVDEQVVPGTSLTEHTAGRDDKAGKDGPGTETSKPTPKPERGDTQAEVKNDNSQNRETTPAPSVSSGADTQGTSDIVSQTGEEENTANQIAAAPTEVAAVTPSPTPVPEKEAETAAPAESEKTPDRTEPTAEPTPEEDEDDGRKEVWNTSFLIKIPMVDFGVFTERRETKTYDYAVFTAVAYDSVKSYIKQLKGGGYATVTSTEKDGLYTYEGERTDGWVATISYVMADGWMCLGLGYYDEDEQRSNEEELEHLFNDTLLRYMPAPENVTLLPGYSDGHNDGKPFCVVEGMDEEMARAYIELLEAEGYIYDVDRGDSDGFIWYDAISEELLMCSFVYNAGQAKLGCEFYEED